MTMQVRTSSIYIHNYTHTHKVYNIYIEREMKYIKSIFQASALVFSISVLVEGRGSLLEAGELHYLTWCFIGWSDN
jgi:hypothetical protein